MNSEALKLEVIEMKDALVRFKVSFQKYRTNEFFKNNNEFKASNDVILSSITCPARGRINPEYLYLRGTDLKQDDKIIECTLKEYMDFFQAVKEYNIERELEERIKAK